VAVVTNDVSNVSGFLFPGSRVDVLVSFRKEQEEQAMSTTVVQNVEVLTTGERLEPDPSGKPEHVKVVTLLMTPDDAQRLALAESQGTVR
ncbi:Flp pilus assembly protein CpaB, partial [Klebsiella pneumoniae]|nr:Flp pilus assembly protein CpaB [Klebsiella pneumoniae]